MEMIDLTDRDLIYTENKFREIVKEKPLGKEQSTRVSEIISKVSLPMEVCDDKIAIIRHNMFTTGEEGDSCLETGVELTIKNVSNKIIGSVIFEAVFFDIEGNILNTVKHKTVELWPGISRVLKIPSSNLEGNEIWGYYIKAVRMAMAPEPTAIGNEKIDILNHSLNFTVNREHVNLPVGVNLAIVNISGSIIAAIIFEAIFYDIEGNIIEIVKRREEELKSGHSRLITIKSSVDKHGMVKSYNVRIIQVITAEIEKVQFRRKEMGQTNNGEDEVKGTVKNISNDKTSAAVMVIFYNADNEEIGTRVVILRDIEAGAIRPFDILFKPQDGVTVKTCTFHIGDIAEE
jgi:hypothetical protein